MTLQQFLTDLIWVVVLAVGIIAYNAVSRWNEPSPAELKIQQEELLSRIRREYIACRAHGNEAAFIVNGELVCIGATSDRK